MCVVLFGRFTSAQVEDDNDLRLARVIVEDSLQFFTTLELCADHMGVSTFELFTRIRAA